MSLEDLEIYQLALKLSDDIWGVYQQLPKNLKFNIGDQLLRAVDSIGANISEGFGRYHYKDSMKFYYNARGSLFESKYWLQLLFKRKLINTDKYDELKNKLDLLGIKLNNFINSIKATINNK
ncbi:four helix bundle protein [Deferribacter autotrophicus]|uniref:Four helix bundle protein n=1 Tax=Deferribacter autotrophicus TaxID=500465 RepID=A0A5A8F0M9_9BACT|nr:four helix bundle protein [Deferribacter autotrophicus]KAA0257618.1 four helix bundle protein [Deferribacter autotrophicus]